MVIGGGVGGGVAVVLLLVLAWYLKKKRAAFPQVGKVPNPRQTMCRGHGVKPPVPCLIGSNQVIQYFPVGHMMGGLQRDGGDV